MLEGSVGPSTLAGNLVSIISNYYQITQVILVDSRILGSKMDVVCKDRDIAINVLQQNGCFLQSTGYRDLRSSFYCSNEWLVPSHSLAQCGNPRSSKVTVFGSSPIKFPLL